LREVVLDTETTGLDPGSGHRIVEIGCVELVNHMETGETFHAYIDPERDVPEEVVAVHGLTREFLSGHPVFADIADAFTAFIGDSPLVIHNAEFDLRFLDAELERLGRSKLPPGRAIDTVALARTKFPGQQANLDALCRRFRIDISDRVQHGALKDALLLSQVYLELIGGRQRDLALAASTIDTVETETRDRRPPRPHGPSPDEESAHARFLEKISSPIWEA